MENGHSLYALIAKLDARIVELEAQNKRLLWKMLMIKDIAKLPELPKQAVQRSLYSKARA